MGSENKIDVLLSKIEKFFQCEFEYGCSCTDCINNCKPINSDDDDCIFSIHHNEILKELIEEIDNIIKERDNALAALRRKITDEKIAMLQMAIELDMNKYLKGGNNNEGM